MDPFAKLVLLVIAAGLLLGVVFALRRGRHLAALLQGANLALAVAALYRGSRSDWLFYLSCGGYVWLVIIPALLAGITRRMLRRGAWRRAITFVRLRRYFLPGPELERERRMLEALGLASEGRLEEAAADGKQQLAECRDPQLRLVLIEHLLTLHIYARRWQEAVALCEAEGGTELAGASVGIAVALVRAYAECGYSAAAARCLAILEESPAATSPAAALMVNGARLSLIAHLGLVDELDGLFADRAAFLPPLSPLQRQLWRGLALARAGRRDEAQQTLQSIAEQQADPRAADVARQRLLHDLETTAKLDQPLRDLAALAAGRVRAYHAVPRTEGRFWKLAPVTTALLAACVLIHLAVELFADAEDPWVLLRLGANFRLAVLGGEPWRLIASMFLHGNLLHIALNGYALYLLGRMVEQMFGSLRFFCIYMVAGIVGALASAGVGGAHHLSVGASGAIFGLIGAALVGLRQLRGHVPEGWRKQLTYNLLVIVALQLYIGFTVEVIDNAAHIGGLLGGAAAALLVRPGRVASARVARQALVVLAAAFVLAILASAVMVARSGATELLARIPRQTFDKNGLSVRGPAHWTKLTDDHPTALALRDPLIGLLQPPTLELVAPLPLAADRDLTAFAREYSDGLRRQWALLTEVEHARLWQTIRRLPGGAVQTRIDLEVHGRRYVNVNVFRRQRDLVLVARLHLPARRLTSYASVIADIARSMHFRE